MDLHAFTCTAVFVALACHYANPRPSKLRCRCRCRFCAVSFNFGAWAPPSQTVAHFIATATALHPTVSQHDFVSPCPLYPQAVIFLIDKVLAPVA